MDGKYKALAVFVVSILIFGAIAGEGETNVERCLAHYQEVLGIRGWTSLWFHVCHVRFFDVSGVWRNDYGPFDYWSIGYVTIILPVLLLAIFVRRRVDAWKARRADI